MNKNSIYKAYISSLEWKNKRKEYSWDVYCACCGDIQATDLHHKTYKNLKNEKDGDLVQLCKDCHYKIHKKEKELRIKYIPDDFLDEPIVVELSKISPLGVDGTYYIGRDIYDTDIYLDYEFKKKFIVYSCSKFTTHKNYAMWIDFISKKGDMPLCPANIPKSTSEIIDLINAQMVGSDLVKYVNSISVEELKSIAIKSLSKNKSLLK